MRRNYPRFSQNAPQNGPLMTNHIELQDLDLELELLKRKRQMIEKQQQLLANDHQFSNQLRNYNYIESPQMFQAPQQQYNSNQYFPHNFGQSSQSFNHFEGGQGASFGKRASDSNWSSGSAPKRLSGPSGGSNKKFGAGIKSRSESLADRPAPFVNQQGPVNKQYSQNVTQSQQQQVWNQLPFYMGSKYTPPSQRYNSTKSKPTNTDFRPNKVTKSKAKSANIANKLISYPIPKRNMPSKEVKKVASKADETGDFILHADKVPTQQVAGRLEMALGSILKDLKQKYGDIDEFKASFLQHIFLREVKQAIRERLRSVMLGKHVGKVHDIIEHYRKVFPPESDKEMVNLAMEAQDVANRKLLITKLEETDSPENYFKINMYKLFDASLDEMFKKLQKLYGDDTTDEMRELFKEILEDKPNVIEDKDVDIEYKDAVKIAEDAEPKENMNNASASENAKSNQYMENTELAKTAESKQNLEKSEAVESELNPNKAEGTLSDKNDEDKNEKANIEDENLKKIENNDNECVSKANTGTNASKDADAAAQSTKDVTNTNQRLKKMEMFISNTINRKMASILPKYKFHILKTLRANPKYNATKKLILSKLEYKLSVANQLESAGKESVSEKTPVKSTLAKPSASSSPASTPSSNPLYYVKVIGRPNLPKKTEMQSFLQKFNPKTVKKHRSMQLLFVGFDNKEDFDKMVAVQETTIDNKRVYIKANEVANRSQKSLNVSVISDDDDVQVISDDTSANTSGNIISSDLDGQIDDLLSSIRKEEELTQKSCDGEVKTVDKTEDATEEAAAKGEHNENVSKQNNEVRVIANGVQNDVVTIDGENDVEEVPNNAENDVEMKANDGGLNENNTDKNTKKESESNNRTENTESEAADKVEALKSDAKQTGRATPTRVSARLNSATPSSIRTRRASRLAQD